MATPTPTPATPALPRPPRAPISPATWVLITAVFVLGLAQLGGSSRPAGQSPIVVTVNVNTADEPPADEPPADEPPADEPPADEPPADEPPVDEPPVAVGRPIRQWRSLAGSVIDARLVSVHGESIRLATDERELTVDLSELCVSDRFYVSNLMSTKVSH